MRKAKSYIKNTALIVVTMMSLLLIFYGIGIIALPAWDVTWIPVQICMTGVGITWITMFVVANAENDEEE